MAQFAHKLGLAFQVQDDILDVTACTETLGKPAGSDEKLDKATYPKIMGLSSAQAYADELFADVQRSLDGFPVDNQLKQLADWLWQRLN